MNPFNPQPKQLEALRLLNRSSPVRQVLYGGAAGGGKTYLGINWQLHRRVLYPATNGFIGRETLADLVKYTVPEMYKTAVNHNLKPNVSISYNGQYHYFELWNKSKIFMLDVGYYPSDPEYHRFGSTEFMDGFIEEGAQVTEKAITILMARLRHRLTEFCRACGSVGLNSTPPVEYDIDGRPISWTCCKCGSTNGGMIPKMLITANPNPGFLRTSFYDPYVNGTLDPDKAYVPASVKDNIYLPAEYIKSLEGLPEMDRRRLLYGDWDYSTASDTMFAYSAIQAMFSDRLGEGDYYITADVARLGKDTTVIGVWHGFVLIEIVQLKKSLVSETTAKIRELMLRYNVTSRRVIVDEDGVGGGVVDGIGCVGFQNGGAPVDRERFTKAKDECYFKLAEYVEQNRISIRAVGFNEVITKELSAVRREKPDGDTKLRVISKDKMKVLLNNSSPDFADMLMMRMYTEVRKNGVNKVRVLSVNNP